MSYRLGDRTTIKGDEVRPYEAIVPTDGRRPKEASGNAFSDDTRLRCVGRRDGAVILHAWGDERIAEQERHRQRMLDRHEKAMGASVPRPRGPFPAVMGETPTGGIDAAGGNSSGGRDPMGPGGSEAPGGATIPERGGGGFYDYSEVQEHVQEDRDGA